MTETTTIDAIALNERIAQGIEEAQEIQSAVLMAAGRREECPHCSGLGRPYAHLRLFTCNWCEGRGVILRTVTPFLAVPEPDEVLYRNLCAQFFVAYGWPPDAKERAYIRNRVRCTAQTIPDMALVQAAKRALADG